MTDCERCSRTVMRRRRCVICKRMLCRDCQELPRMIDEVVWCRLYDELGCPMRDCKPLDEARRETTHGT